MTKPNPLDRSKYGGYEKKYSHWSWQSSKRLEPKTTPASEMFAECTFSRWLKAVRMVVTGYVLIVQSCRNPKTPNSHNPKSQNSQTSAIPKLQIPQIRTPKTQNSQNPKQQSKSSQLIRNPKSTNSPNPKSKILKLRTNPKS